MVGFKFFTLGISLIASMVITSCVPQAKQTTCGPDEAFSPTQRQCLPIKPGETALISIQHAVPSAATIQTASSSLPLTFTVSITNPYRKQYRLKWTRNFNGIEYTVHSASNPSSEASDHPYSIDIIPTMNLHSAVGRHNITAQVLEADSNRVITSHDFALDLVTDPTPHGQNFYPGFSFPVTKTPLSDSIQYSFEVFKNSRLLNDPVVRWRLIKLTGTPLANYEFVNVLDRYSGASEIVRYTFNPKNPHQITPAPLDFHQYIGHYRLEASIMDGARIFSTYSWEINMTHVPLGEIVAVTSPDPNTSTGTVRVFNNVPYSNVHPSNFSWRALGDLDTSRRSELCVEVSDPGGRYDGGVTVRYYIGNESNFVWEGHTNAVKPTVCLDEAPTSVKDYIRFYMVDPNTVWSSKITARVFDTESMEEYPSSSVGGYPIVWTVLGEPQNNGPKILPAQVPNSLVCTGSSSAVAVTGCKVTQDNLAVNNSFVIAFRIEDGFYDITAQDPHIAYVGRLTRGGNVVDDTTCTKTFAQVGSSTDNGIDNIDDFQGPVYTCRINVPSFDDYGSIDPTSSPWNFTVTASNNGSPYTTTPKSNSLTWNLNVTELNTPPAATVQVVSNTAPFSVISSATERDSIIFQVNYSDGERDPYRIEVSKCESLTTCNTPGAPLVTTASVFFNNPLFDWALNRRAVLTIPDGMVPDITTPTPIRFRIRVMDLASTATAVNAIGVVAPSNQTDVFITLPINNFNPAPVFANVHALNTTLPGVDPLNPAGIDFTAFGSFPLSLDPGVITDGSNPGNPAEGTIRYHWWIKEQAETVWKEIIRPNNKKILEWTPGPDMVSGLYDITLCVTDNSPSRPDAKDPNIAMTHCNTPSLIKVESNVGLGNLIDSSAATNEKIWGAPAVWIDTTASSIVATHPNSKVIYSAYARHETTGPGIVTHINVAKFFYNADNNGKLEKIGEISFPAIDPRTPTHPRTTDVREMSMTGDEESLYIGYLAHYDLTGSFDQGGRPEIRRIRKDFTVGGASRTNGAHPAPFGFGYEGFYISDSLNCQATGCWSTPVSAAITGGTIDFDSTSITGPITVNFSFDDPATVTGSITATGATNADIASDLATKINSSTDPVLQGFTALYDGNTVVTINGPIADDYIRIDQVATKVGKIMYSAGSVLLPFINASTPAPNTNTVTIVHFNTGIHQSLSAMTIQQQNYEGTQASDLDNTLDKDGNVLLAYTSTNDPGQAKLIKFTGINVNDPGIVANNILGPHRITRIKIAGNNDDNNNYYAIGRAFDENKLVMTRIPSTFSPTPGNPDLNMFWEFSETTDSVTAAFVQDLKDNDTMIWDFSVKAAAGDAVSSTIDEARILIATEDGTYAFRGLPNRTVSCGTCLPIQNNNMTFPNDGRKTIDVSEILAGQSLGTGGNTFPGSQTRSVMAFAYVGQDVAGGSPDQRMYMMLLNADRTSIDSTTRDGVDGLFTPSIFKK